MLNGGISTVRRKGGNMTNAEAKAHLLKWVKQDLFAWPTDGCGYDQHIRFVNHRNENWADYYERVGGDEDETFRQFVVDYANSLKEEG